MNEESDNNELWDFYYSRINPKDITRRLRMKGIVAQDAAVKAASLIMYNHAHNRTTVNLFIGPSGCGKTEIWRILQRDCGDSKIVIHDASALTPEGWKGDNKLSTIFKDIPPGQRGRIILVLDEFDKLIEPYNNDSSYSDLRQNQLLRLCDHDKLYFGNDKETGFFVDTSGITIIFTGAFQRLMEKKSCSTGSMGFGAQLSHKCDYSNTKITYEDLIEYGMREEMAGRINTITCLNPLGIEALTQIGQHEIINIEQRLRRKIIITDDMLFELAHEAEQKGLGARWLKSQLNNAVNDLLYENPDAESFTVCNDEHINDEQSQKAASME